jgi:secondary thiamine-phosphate synthase enzyme
VTAEIEIQLLELSTINVGIVNLFLQHTSAGLTINENSDPTVISDLSECFQRLIPENQSYFEHTCVGGDDMPAHIKSTLSGCQLTLPIINGRLGLGLWQGIYLGEFRNHGGKRRILVTVHGE